MRTFCAWHLGDNLMFLNFLRRVAHANPDQQFIHHTQHNYLHQLRDVVEDVPNITLEQYDHTTPAAINAWIGADRYWFEHPHRNDFVVFYLDWFERLARQMRVENPIHTPHEMLFDYPKIQEPLPAEFNVPFDMLAINCAPCSGQFREYDSYALAQLIGLIAAKGHKVISTNPVPGAVSTIGKLSITQIGQLSLHCPTIIMVSTGPSWPTFNIWNTETVETRIIFLDDQRVNLAPHSYHCRTLDEAKIILRQAGLL